MGRTVMENFIPEKEYTREVERKIPRNQYKHCHIEPLMKYFCRYNFEKYCTRFEIIDRELDQKVKLDRAFDALKFLDDLETSEVHGNELGIPIVSLTCYYNESDADDPYFICRIVVDHKGTAIRARPQSYKTYSVEK